MSLSLALSALAPSSSSSGPFAVGGALVDTTPVTLYAPWTRSAVHLGLELVIVGIAVATLVHAWRARRRGDLVPLFTWATIFVYGLTMEILSYHFVKNFTHAQFSVMFYDRQLPLYVTAVYPAMLYVGIMTARRLGLGRVAAPFAAGLLIVAIDMPFDILGPPVGWWTWSDTDPNIAFRWMGVPVTSYYWHLCFGGVLAALTAAMGPRVRTIGKVAWAIPFAALTIVGGLLCFVPFHLLAKLGVAHGTIVAAALALSFLVLVSARRHVVATPDRLLLALPLTFYAFHLLVALRLAPAKPLAVILAVTAFATVVNVVVHRRPRSVPAVASSPL